MERDESEKLFQCPFCGGEAEVGSDHADGDKMCAYGSRITCKDCGASICSDDWNVAFMKWNKRFELSDIHDIGWAVIHLKRGFRVTRRGWNGKGMWLELQRPDEHSKMSLPYVYMSTAQGDLVPWLCSQTDLLAEDWMVV